MSSSKPFVIQRKMESSIRKAEVDKIMKCWCFDSEDGKPLTEWHLDVEHAPKCKYLHPCERKWKDAPIRPKPSSESPKTVKPKPHRGTESDRPTTPISPCSTARLPSSSYSNKPSPCVSPATSYSENTAPIQNPSDPRRYTAITSTLASSSSTFAFAASTTACVKHTSIEDRIPVQGSIACDFHDEVQVPDSGTPPSSPCSTSSSMSFDSDDLEFPEIKQRRPVSQRSPKKSAAQLTIERERISKRIPLVGTILELHEKTLDRQEVLGECLASMHMMPAGSLQHQHRNIAAENLTEKNAYDGLRMLSLLIDTVTDTCGTWDCVGVVDLHSEINELREKLQSLNQQGNDTSTPEQATSLEMQEAEIAQLAIEIEAVRERMVDLNHAVARWAKGISDEIFARFEERKREVIEEADSTLERIQVVFEEYDRERDERNAKMALLEARTTLRRQENDRFEEENVAIRRRLIELEGENENLQPHFMPCDPASSPRSNILVNTHQAHVHQLVQEQIQTMRSEAEEIMQEQKLKCLERNEKLIGTVLAALVQRTEPVQRLVTVMQDWISDIEAFAD